MLQTVNVDGTLRLPQRILVAVDPPTYGIETPASAPCPAILAALAEPEFSRPTRPLPLRSWNSCLDWSQLLAVATRYAGYIKYVPAAQMVQIVAPANEYLPASQSAHVEAPTALENLPAAQSLQTEAPAAAAAGAFAFGRPRASSCNRARSRWVCDERAGACRCRKGA